MRRINLRNIRSSVFGCLIALFLFPSSFIFSFEKASATSMDEHTSRLVEGAKKEGQVRFNTGMTVAESDKLLRLFNKKYPFIKTRLDRSAGPKKITQLLAEARAGVHNFDVCQTSVSLFAILKENGLVAKYTSPESKYFPENLIDPEGYWTDHYSSNFVMGYNTKLVRSEEAPKNLTDLLNPKWKGKMGMDGKAFEWFSGVLRIMGEEKGLKYFESLSGQGIQFRIGKSLVTQLLAAGEFGLGITLYRERIEEMKDEGAPLEWIAVEPLVTILHPIFIASHTPHPNAARLFVDFLLSEEGQEVLVDFHRRPSRMGVKAKDRGRQLKENVKLLPYDLSFLKDYNRHVKLF